MRRGHPRRTSRPEAEDVSGAEIADDRSAIDAASRDLESVFAASIVTAEWGPGVGPDASSWKRKLESVTRDWGYASTGLSVELRLQERGLV